jgi:streptogramin lyase
MGDYEGAISDFSRAIKFNPRHAPAYSKGKMVIANRASGMISVIDVASDRVIGTYALPASDKMPEPMYVVYSRGRVFVGDRANNRVAVFNPRTFAVQATVPAGAGVWHMWADPFDRQLWVANDIDKTCTVIDPLTLQVLATVPTPADLAAAGGKPHEAMRPRPELHLGARDAESLRAEAEGGGISRLYDGTHWGFDVEAGLAIGRRMSSLFSERARRDGAYPAR